LRFEILDLRINSFLPNPKLQLSNSFVGLQK